MTASQDDDRHLWQWIEVEVEYVRKETKKVRVDVAGGISSGGAVVPSVGMFSRSLNYHMHDGKDLVAHETPRLLSWRLIDPPTCGKDVGSRPSWMSPDQYDGCPCVLPEGHDGPCECGCDRLRPAQDGGQADG